MWNVLGYKPNWTDLYFLQICPNCGERMKYMRKISEKSLYTCYNCYKRWTKKEKEFTEIKLQTK
jgi:predicted nucleic acid-binding Zn ribbon protein